jgi:predicted phosphodiesterase
VKILTISDEECDALWDHYSPGRLKQYDLIISCGDLKPDYLSFLVTMARCPLLYVHGNHDGCYQHNPPEGCDCIDDHFVVYNGIRILGLGGCRRYRPGDFQYTNAQMRRRIMKLRWQLWKHKGVDIVVTHAPAEGLGDGEDPAHWGFPALRTLLDDYTPQYMLYGHVHLRYSDHPRVMEYNGITLINACERYEFDIPNRDVPFREKNILQWKTRHREF